MVDGDCNICPVRLRRMGLGVHILGVAFFWWLNLVRLYSLYKNTIPQKEDRTILGTIVPPNEILLMYV